MKKDCPITGCREERVSLFCQRHWRMVPRALRDRIRLSWRKGVSMQHGPTDFREAIKEAFAIVHRQERLKAERAAADKQGELAL